MCLCHYSLHTLKKKSNDIISPNKFIIAYNRPTLVYRYITSSKMIMIIFFNLTTIKKFPSLPSFSVSSFFLRVDAFPVPVTNCNPSTVKRNRPIDSHIRSYGTTNCNPSTVKSHPDDSESCTCGIKFSGPGGTSSTSNHVRDYDDYPCNLQHNILYSLVHRLCNI